ncbi:MAG: flavin-containing monooxygenase [Acidimicrobiales bacterium]
MKGTSLRIIIIGAGMAGIAAGVMFREAGYDDLVIYEKGDRIGGTWRENTYPGVACDVPSHLYSYSFAPNPEWSHVFAPGMEIRDYLDSVARHRDIERLIVYRTEVADLEWCDRRWHLTTVDGRRDEADIVIAATGVLHHPAYPEISGLENFEGAMFHSARWDHRVSIAGARVGVIGTGSSAVQIVGAIVDTVEELHLFQRTPQWVLPVPNLAIGEEDKARYRSDPREIEELREELSLTFTKGFANAVVDAESPQAKLLEDLCRANLDESVPDLEFREQLRPNYRAACKRLVVSPNFYQAVQHSHARVVSDPIQRVEAGGVRTADGRLHHLDVLVLATGFRVDRFLRPIQVTGRGGVSLDDTWSKRPSAYLSVSIPNFPNLFLLNGPNGPVGNFSLIDVAELQLHYILQLTQNIKRGACAEVSASAAATERFEAERVEATKRTVWVTGCNSWYLDDRGVPAAWPWTMDHFREVMVSPDLADFDLVGSGLDPEERRPSTGKVNRFSNHF